MVKSSPIPSAISLSLRSAQLKRLAFLCGLPVVGRKDELLARLTAALSKAPSPAKSRPEPVVLSIDLGIKNLALSLLTPASPSASAAGKKTAPRSKARSSTNQAPKNDGTDPPFINLHTWRRLSLIESAARALARDGEEAVAEVETPGAIFAPAALAKTTYEFLKGTVLRLEPAPTHILIERQRWRSNGSTAIQEWTVRVNSLEAMLHASLQTLRDVGIWDGDVISVRPESSGQLFLDAEGSSTGAKDIVPDEVLEELETGESASKPKKRRAKKTSMEAKKQKISILNRWLDQGGLIEPRNTNARRMLDAYRVASKRFRRSRSEIVVMEDETGEIPLVLDKKLDDLTDSLLQGMAWLRWQENMAVLQREGGIEQLLGEDILSTPAKSKSRTPAKPKPITAAKPKPRTRRKKVDT